MENGEVPNVEDDDDDWLKDLVAETVAILAEKDTVAKAKKRLAAGVASKTEREELTALVSHYEEARTWTSVAQVALIHVQACRTCGHHEYLFQGWMVEQQHKVQPTTRRLIAGESPLRLPYRKERHYLKPREQCTHCLDSYIRARQMIVPYQFQNHRKEEK